MNSIRIKNTLFLVCLQLFTLALNAQNSRYQVLSNTQDQTLIDIYPGDIRSIPVHTPQGNEVKITLSGATQLLEKGSPDLPKLTYSLIIPNQKNSTVTVLESQFTDYTNVSIAPGKGSISRTIDPASIPFEYGKAYQTNAFFPENKAELNKPYILRDFRGQTLMIHPVQYNPITKVMRVYTHLKVKVTYDGISTGNTLPASGLPDAIVEEFDGMYKNHFVNYKTTGIHYTPVLEQGSMLILCPAVYLSEIAPFVKWKEMKGIKTYLVNTDTVTGGVSATTIKSLSTYYYKNKHIAYMLIVGDNTLIPPRMPNGLNPPDFAGPSDNAYAYIDNGDHYPEFVVGRFSGETAAEIRTQVKRTLQYEQTPNTSSNWMSTQIGVGSEFGTGDDNQFDFEHIHNIVDSNKNQYKYLTNIEQYDDTCTSAANLLGTDLLGPPSTTMLKDAINNGASLINYCGHGFADGVITTGFQSVHIPTLSNVNKLPFFFVVGCSPGEFVNYTCFAENLQRAETTSSEPYGTISNFMSTISQNWDEPMQAQDEFNGIMRGARPGNLKARLGAMCMDACMSMNDQYDVFSNPNGITGGSDMTDAWIFFGDPTVSLYTKNEGALSMTFDTHIQQNSTTYEVHCPVDGATIGLYYQGQYLASNLVYGGIAYFSFPALTALDTVFITATKQNYTPAYGTALVVNWATGVDNLNTSNELIVYPNPTTDLLQIKNKNKHALETVQVINASGQQVLEYKTNNSSLDLSSKLLPAGLYTLKVINKDGVSTRSFSKQ